MSSIQESKHIHQPWFTLEDSPEEGTGKPDALSWVPSWRTKLALCVLYHMYLFWGIYYTWDSTLLWCNNIKLLTTITIGLYVVLCTYLVAIRFTKYVSRPSTSGKTRRWVRLFCWSTLAFIIALTIVDGRENFSRIISLCGLVVLVLAGYVFSKECSEVDWSQVTSSLDVVYVLAFVFLRVDWGEESCHRQLVSYSADLFNSGTGVLFGPLARGINMAEHLGNASVATIAPVFTFSVLPVICCVAAMVKILYYMGVIQFLLYHMEGVLSQTTRFNACEVFYAFVTFFLGPVESLVFLYPYFDTLTASNLHCVLTMAFSSITGRLLTSFVGFGIDDKYMTAAAVMSIPTAFAYSKLCYPETRGAAMSAESLLQVPREKSVVEAAVAGAVLGLYLITCCVGNIVTYMSLSRFANTMFDWGTSNLGFETATLEGTLSFIISPLALLIGVPREDCKAVGNLIAVKILHSEHAAYQRLSVTDLLERSQMMAKFSLCGVGNLSILGMVMGAMFVLCPDRAPAVSSMILRVFLTCAGAALLMACVAGSLLD